METEKLDGFYLDFNHNDVEDVVKKRNKKTKFVQTQYIKVLSELKKNLEKIN
jgi:hypothetical protein